jgi:hypothetical protein
VTWRTLAACSATVNPPGAGARASAADSAGRIRGLVQVDPGYPAGPALGRQGQFIEQEPGVGALQGGGEPVRHRGQHGDDLGEVIQAAAAAQLLGVVHGGLETQHALALGISLQLQPPEANAEPAQPIPWLLDHDPLPRRAGLAVAVRPALQAEDGADCRDVQPRPSPVQYPVEQGLHLRTGPEQQVAGVFGLVDRVAVAEPAALLLLEVQAEAQARRIDPPVADLAQAPYSRLPRSGICDPRQALRIRDLSKAVPLLGEPGLFGLPGDRDILMAVEDHLRAERQVPGHLDDQVPERRVHDVKRVVVDVLPLLLQPGDDPARRAVHLPHARRRLRGQDQEHPGRH